MGLYSTHYNHTNMPRGAIKVTLLPVSTMGRNEKLQDSKRRRSEKRKTPSNTYLRETCGLSSLALIMMYKASLMTSISYSITIPDDVKDYLFGVLLVVVTIFLRKFVMVEYVDKLRHALDTNKTWLTSIGTSLTRVASSSGTNLSAWKTSTSNLMSVVSNGKQRNDTAQQCILSASESFVSLELVEALSLSDVARVFQYAMDYNNNDASQQEKQDEQEAPVSPALTQVLEAMDRAAASTFGGKQDDNDSSTPHTSNGMDALLFCAALRIFAEWRMLRQAPKSFNKGYEMGMSLGKRDLIQNVAKMETAIHAYLQVHTNSRPTIQDLLEYEVSQDVHQALPKLVNESAAMGLLWSKRQVDYQAQIYSNLLDSRESQDAVKAAYKTVFSQYHGWWIQKVFQQSFRSAPPAMEIYKKMTYGLVEPPATADESVPSWAESSCSSFDDSNISDVSFSHQDALSCHSQPDEHTYDDPCQEPSVECQLFGLHLWDKASKHVQSEWDKLVEGTVALFQGRPPRLTARAVQQHDSQSNLIKDTHRSVFAPENPIQQVAHQQFEAFLETSQPMIQQLDSLLERYNMNDPTKV